MSESVVGKTCKLTRPLRDPSGRLRQKHTEAKVLRELINLDRIMYLIRIDADTTTFVFPNEVEFDGNSK